MPFHVFRMSTLVALVCSLASCDFFGLDEEDRVPAAVAIHSGNGQSGVVGAPLAEPLVVVVTNAEGKGVRGVTVTWEASGGSIEATSVTDASGLASASWTLGSVAGAQTATATVEGFDPVTFEATGLPAELTVVALEVDTVHLTTVGEERELSVRITDEFGNDVDPPSEPVWTVLDTEIATVSEAGVVTSRSVGRSMLVVTVGPLADTAVILSDETVRPERKRVVAQGGRVIIDVPAGAISENVLVNVVAAAPGDQPDDDAHMAGTAYRFSPSGLAFAKPVLATIAYDPEEIPAGKAEGRLRMHSVEDGAWAPVQLSRVDTAANTVSAEITGFSIKGLLFGPGYVQLAIAREHACALDEHGKAYCWGDDGWSRLGDGTLENRATPATPAA